MGARRAIWRGEITFAGIRVPVKLYSAVQDDRIAFHLLHDQDSVRLLQQLTCELEDKPVEKEEIVKGLQIDQQQFVEVEQKELDELEPQSDRSIDVTRFVPREQIDARFCDRPYYLGPDGEPDKYASLAEALGKSGKAGICQWAFRKRSYAGMLVSRGDRLELVTLRTADQVLPVEELKLSHAKLSEKEKKTAEYLVKELTAEFEPSEYRNDFREALEGLIETKLKGGKIKKVREKPPSPTDPDRLMRALEASLKEVRQRKAKR